MRYSIDTSALMDAWHRYYPPDVFHTLWGYFDDLVTAGRLFAVDEVRRELEKKDDNLFEWVFQHRDMIVALDEPIQRRAMLIIDRFPSLTNTKSRMSGSADPFVIALAQERELTVVTAEHSRPTKPKIPDVCEMLGIPSMSLVQVFRQEGWRV